MTRCSSVNLHVPPIFRFVFCFFFNDTATTEIYTLSLHDALPICLCTVPCSGAVYLGVLSLLALQPSALVGYSYLVLYNLIFVLPLVVILIAASARPTLNRLVHWNLHHKEWVRLALG